MTLAVIGGKWKAPILWHLLEADGPMRFAALKRAIPAITQRMLARQLRELESHGIVYRDVYPVVPPRVEYGITKTGKTLVPVLDAMASWADKRGK
ncbi:MAG TPA: helix-turn-helix domain-containing protein [Alphaproteobacteria bacterium]